MLSYGIFYYAVQRLNCDHSNQSSKEYFPVVLFIMSYKVDFILESGRQIRKPDNKGAVSPILVTLATGIATNNPISAQE